MQSYGKKLVDLVEHGKVAIHRSEQEARSRSGEMALSGNHPSDLTSRVEELAGRLLVLARTRSGDQTVLKLEALRAIEGFIIAIGAKR